MLSISVFFLSRKGKARGISRTLSLPPFLLNECLSTQFPALQLIFDGHHLLRLFASCTIIFLKSLDQTNTSPSGCSRSTCPSFQGEDGGLAADGDQPLRHSHSQHRTSAGQIRIINAYHCLNFSITASSNCAVDKAYFLPLSLALNHSRYIWAESEL